MKPSSSGSDAAKAAVANYVDRIAVPRYNAAAMEARSHGIFPQARSRGVGWRAVAAAAVAIAFVAAAPAVIAQVQRVIQAFTLVDGRLQSVPVQEVSLERLRADMPFTVIAPAGIPRGFNQEIDEIAAGEGGAHATFHYSIPGGPPVLTIDESAATGASPANLFVMRYRANDAASGAGNGTRFTYNVTPITWIARGTRITLIALPGTLSRLQIDSILRAMR